MNYTKNHHLPQWEESDRILMTDFNQMCSDMESGLDKIQDEAAAGRQSIQEIVNKIQKDLGTQGKNVRMICGSYVGTGRQGPDVVQTIQTGFTPALMLVTGGSSPEYDVKNRSSLSIMIRNFNRALAVGITYEHIMHVTWGKDRVSWYCPDRDSTASAGLWQNNYKNATYFYVIFGYTE